MTVAANQKEANVTVLGIDPIPGISAGRAGIHDARATWHGAAAGIDGFATRADRGGGGEENETPAIDLAALRGWVGTHESGGGWNSVK
jgi:hypothetical protein